MIDHDRLFKELLSTFFREFIELFAPTMAEQVDWSSLKMIKTEMWTDITQGERHEVDLLGEVKWRDQERCFLIHVENQASRSKDFAERMFIYYSRLYQMHRKNIYPMAVLSYDAPRKVEPDRLKIEFPGLRVLDFHFQTVQLNRLSWRDFAKHRNPVATALMAKMNIAADERARVKLECLRLLVTMKLDPARTQLISGFVDTYLELNAVERAEFEQELSKEPRKRQEAIMNIGGNWFKEGMQQGMQQGRQQEASHLVLLILPERVGGLTKKLEQQVRELPTERLEALAKALLHFNTRSDLENWLKQ